MKNEVTLHPRLSRGMVALVSLAACLVLGAVVTAAVFAQSDKTINGCKNKKSGALRIISSSGSCKSTETAISWNKTGPPGPQGEQGEPPEAEAWHEVGAAGEPGFTSGSGCTTWQNLDPLLYNTAGFFKDPSGVVHLKGMIKGGRVDGCRVVFQLPPGYRPAALEHPVVGACCPHGSAGRLFIWPNGEVELVVFGGSSADVEIALDSITFRAAE